MTLPHAFVLTRIGVETGMDLDTIFAYKELERRSNDEGRFAWGIGNAVRTDGALEVAFIGVKKPQPIDITPDGALFWNDPRLPAGSFVITRRNTRTGKQKRAYALICASDKPLGVDDLGVIDLGMLCNVHSGKPLGASQNTALVQPFKGEPGNPRRVILWASLIEVLALRNPVALSPHDHRSAMEAAKTGKVEAWRSVISEIKRKASSPA